MDTNPFWTYSLSAYGIDRVREIMLHWQDDYGGDVNILLCCCWLASKQQRLDEDQLSLLLKAGAHWRAQCLLPLRSVRRFVREQPATDLLYQQLKDAEISAEQWHQQCLFDCIEGFEQSPASGIEGAGMDNLQNYCQFLSGVEWSDLSEDATELLGALKL